MPNDRSAPSRLFNHINKPGILAAINFDRMLYPYYAKRHIQRRLVRSKS